MNSVQLIGNLTRDPELKKLGSETSVCSLRLAVNGRRKDASSGEWVESPNYFDVVVYGRQADVCAEHLEKGRKVAVTGRLEYREWQTDAGRRSTVEIVASEVDFLATRSGAAASVAVEEAAEPAAF